MRYEEFASGLQETILEAKDVGEFIKQNRYGTEDFGTWEIKYDNMPNPTNGKHRAIAWLKRDEKVKANAEGDTVEAAITAVKDRIEFMNKVNATVQKFTKANLCFNVEFTRDVLQDGVTGVRLVGHGNATYLLVAQAEWVEAGGADVYGLGPDKFVHLQSRLPVGRIDGSEGGAAQIYGANITAKQIKELGLQPNGRYALDYVDEDEYAKKYRLVFDSVTKGPSDKVRLHKPGLTVAVY
jgi:hypothetical protein